MTKLGSIFRSLGRYPLLFIYNVRHWRNKLRSSWRVVSETSLAGAYRLRTRAYKAVGAIEPVSIYEQRERLLEFYAYYEQLIDCICSAAHYEVTDALEIEYARYRQWMNNNYLSIKPYLSAYVTVNSDDDAFGIAVAGKPADAYQALFFAPTLAVLLDNDNGALIDRMMRTRDALNLYADHLRKLASAQKARKN